MPRLLIVLFVCAIGYQFYHWYYGDQGVKRQKELTKQIDYQKGVNTHLKQRNEALRAQVFDLRSGEEAIEEHIRTDLQYIKSGEVFYRIMDK